MDLDGTAVLGTLGDGGQTVGLEDLSCGFGRPNCQFGSNLATLLWCSRPARRSLTHPNLVFCGTPLTTTYSRSTGRRVSPLSRPQHAVPPRLASCAAWLILRLLRYRDTSRGHHSRPCSAPPRSDRVRSARQPRPRLPRLQCGEGRHSARGVPDAAPLAWSLPASLRRSSLGSAQGARSPGLRTSDPSEGSLTA